MNYLFHQAALGDWVLTFPILRALGPEPTRAVSGGGKARLAARLFPHVEAYDIERWSFLFAADHCGTGGGGLVGGGAWDELGKARRIINFVGDGGDAWGANLRRLAPAAEHFFVAARPPEDWRGHICDWHVQQLRAQGLALPEVAALPGGDSDGPIVVHPGSGGRGKCWAIERFEALVNGLRGDGYEVLPIVGEVEVDSWPKPLLAHWLNELGAKMLPTLDGLSDALGGAGVFVGNDAGPTHLAAQMGVPTLALFGPTSPVRWAPRGLRVRVLAPPTPRAMDWLEVDGVMEACRGMKFGGGAG